jgi:hypothetical protein
MVLVGTNNAEKDFEESAASSGDSVKAQKAEK